MLKNLSTHANGTHAGNETAAFRVPKFLWQPLWKNLPSPSCSSGSSPVVAREWSCPRFWSTGLSPPNGKGEFGGME